MSNCLTDALACQAADMPSERVTACQVHGSHQFMLSALQVHESLRRHQASIQCRAAQAGGPSNPSHAAVHMTLGLPPLLPPPSPPPQQQQQAGSTPPAGVGGRQTRSRAAMTKAAAAGVVSRISHAAALPMLPS